MIALRLLDGQTATVAPEQFIRFRQAFLPAERATRAVSIVDADQRYSVLDTVESLAAALRAHMSVPIFTAPAGIDVFVVANKVTDIHPALHRTHHDRAQAVLRFAGGLEQQVRQAVDEATRRIEAAVEAEKPRHEVDENLARFELGEIDRSVLDGK